MKKKIYVVVMAIVIAMSSLVGCGNKTNTKGPEAVSENVVAVRESVVKKFLIEHPDYNREIYDEYFDGAVCYDEAVEAPGADNGVSKRLNSSVAPLSGATDNPGEFPTYDWNTEEYNAIKNNIFHQVSMNPLSTFSADVDTASYSNLRRFITSGYGRNDIPAGAVRTEEMINYFSYDYNKPTAGEPFGVTTVISDCPWNKDTKLVSVGLQTDKIDFTDAPDSNIVFLIDVSGSMYDENKLPLLKQSFIAMLDELGEKDRVSIVTYAGEDKVVLEGVPASDKQTIIDALNSLEAGGGTNGGKGIVSAYQLAEENFIDGGNNRVIIATDGDLNIGVTNASDLEELIKEEAETGVYLTVLGFGMGNYSDTNLETIADNGNGNYAYIDNLKEAKKVLCEELGATMLTVAKDVKLQVEFNPAVVAEYRLIGYEDRALNNEDFNDDTKDAGEIGAGHSVTALYEVKLAGDDKSGTSLKYQGSELTDKAKSGEWMTLSVRYKEPTESKSKLLEYPIGNESYTDKPSDDFIFASAVAELAQIVKGDECVGDATYDDVLELLSSVKLNDEYKEEFKFLVENIKHNEQ